MKKFLIVALLVIGVVALSFFSKGNSSGSVSEVTTFIVEERLLESTVLATGVLTYGDERSIRSQVTAMVEKVWVDEGDLVEKDQILISLDQENFELDLDTQKAAVVLRRIEIERSGLRLQSLLTQQVRLQTLYDQEVAQTSALEDIQDQIKLAKVDLKAQAQLLKQSEYSLHKASDLMNKTTIRSPMKGLVSALDIKVGEMAVSGGSGGLALLTMVDPSKIYTEIDVDEADIGKVSEGLPVRVFAIAYPNVVIEGTVETIATSARNVPGKSALVFPVDAIVQHNDSIKLRPGMSTRAEIISLAKNKTPVVLIESVRDSSDRSYSVFRIEDGTAMEIVVTLGDQDDRYQAIKSGVKVGDEVVTGPYSILRTLKSGSLISINNQDIKNDSD